MHKSLLLTIIGSVVSVVYAASIQNVEETGKPMVAADAPGCDYADKIDVTYHINFGNAKYLCAGGDYSRFKKESAGNISICKTDLNCSTYNLGRAKGTCTEWCTFGCVTIPILEADARDHCDRIRGHLRTL